MSLVLVPSYLSPALSDTAGGLTYEEFELVDELYGSLRAGDTDEALDRAVLLGGKYFLLRNDVLERQSVPHISYGPIASEERPSIYEAILRSSDDLSLVGQWGEWSVFEIAEGRLLPHIYPVRPELVKFSYVDGNRVPVFFGTGPPPSLRFKRINPAKYVVQVRDAESPFLLVLADRFSSDWKLYQASDRREDFEPVASYLNGAVVEGEQSATFLEPEFVETWMRGPLHEDFHVKVHGYANGWYVTNAGSYDLIIEYWPQRLFYLGLAITVVSTMAAVGYLVVSGAYGLRRRI
jgi:hypothetical protein